MLPLIDKILRDNEYVRSGEPEQHQFTEEAVVYRIPTTKGNVYFKVVPDGSNEVVQTRCIGKLFPDITASLIGNTVNLNALLSVDFGPAVSDLCFFPKDCNPAPGYEDQAHVASLILQQWADIQQSSVTKIGELASAGVPVYDESWIRQSFEEVLSFLLEHDSIPSEIAARTHSYHAHVERTLDLWSTTQVPATIVHGDLHEKNIAHPEGLGSAFLFFDWDSAFIGHSFLDLLGSESHPLYRHESSYLQCWTKYGNLQSSSELAAWTKPLQYLVSAAFELKNSALLPKTRDILVEIYSTEFCESAESVQGKDGRKLQH